MGNSHKSGNRRKNHSDIQKSDNTRSNADKIEEEVKSQCKNTLVEERVSESTSKLETSENQLKDEENEVWKIAGRGIEPKQLTYPLGVSIDREGNYYVTNGTPNVRVTCYNSRGEFIRCIGDKLSKRPAKYPWGVAVSQTGVIFVPDRDHKEIMMYNTQGEYIDSIRHGFGTPEGICLIEDKNLVAVSDYGRNEVVVFGSSGECIGSFGSEVLKGPVGIAVNSQQDIIVASTAGKKVSVFKLDGIHEFDFGHTCKLTGSNATSLSVDQTDRVIVSDYGYCRLLWFQPDGELIGEIGPKGLGVDGGEFKSPLDARLNVITGRLIVCIAPDTEADGLYSIKMPTLEHE